MIDSIKLRKAICSVLAAESGLLLCYNPAPGFLTLHREDVQILLEAAQLALPKTKMVEQWRVEFAQEKVPYSASFHHESLAIAYAKTVRSWANTDCVRVTGPHQQEVPI